MMSHPERGLRGTGHSLRRETSAGRTAGLVADGSEVDLSPRAGGGAPALGLGAGAPIRGALPLRFVGAVVLDGLLEILGRPPEVGDGLDPVPAVVSLVAFQGPDHA